MSTTLYDDFMDSSFPEILEEAQNYLHQYQNVNNPLVQAWKSSIPPESFTVVRAWPDGTVEFNYASRGMQVMMVRDLPKVETLIDVGWRKMTLTHDYMEAGSKTFEALQKETERWIDSLRAEGALNEGEIRDFACESIAPFFAPG